VGELVVELGTDEAIVPALVELLSHVSRYFPPFFSPCQTRSSLDLEEVISVDTWWIDADVLARSTSRF